MEKKIKTKANPGDFVLAFNPKRKNRESEFFKIKSIEYLNFGNHDKLRYRAVTEREAKNGPINVILTDWDVIEVYPESDGAT